MHCHCYTVSVTVTAMTIDDAPKPLIHMVWSILSKEHAQQAFTIDAPKPLIYVVWSIYSKEIAQQVFAIGAPNPLIHMVWCIESTKIAKTGLLSMHQTLLFAWFGASIVKRRLKKWIFTIH